MSQSFAIDLTSDLEYYIKNLIPTSDTQNYADYIGLYLSGSWTNPSINSGSYLALSSLPTDSQGRYTFTADQATAGRVYLLVPSQQQTADPSDWVAPWSTFSQQPAPTTLDQQSYVYAYGETNFNGTSGNMDTTYIDSFGLPYQLTILDGSGNPTSSSINAGVGIRSQIYNAAKNGGNQVFYKNSAGGKSYTGALVPPANASKGTYDDYSGYLQYLSGQTKSSNYSAWLKNGDNTPGGAYINQLYDGTAAFYNFNGKSGSSGTGYIVIGGTANDSAGSSTSEDYSVIIPWSLSDMVSLGLTGAVNNYKSASQGLVGNFLSQSPYAYQNDITGFWVTGNVFEDSNGKQISPNNLSRKAIQKAFANATPWDISYQNGTYNAPPNDQLPLMVGDVFFGLNKGMLGSSVDFVTGFSQGDVGTKIYQGVSPTMDIGDLPSEAWYSNKTDYLDASASSLYWSGQLNPAGVWTGNEVVGPVAQGLWGPWAWGTNSKNNWNRWSFALGGRQPASGRSWNPQNLASASNPLLPDTYTWSMDDRMGGQLLQFGNSDLQLTFDAPN